MCVYTTHLPSAANPFPKHSTLCPVFFFFFAPLNTSYSTGAIHRGKKQTVGYRVVPIAAAVFQSFRSGGTGACCAVKIKSDSLTRLLFSHPIPPLTTALTNANYERRQISLPLCLSLSLPLTRFTSPPPLHFLHSALLLNRHRRASHC